jgi:hypothetical protein
MIKRFDDIAIYRKTKGAYTGYEVVRITLSSLHPFDKEKRSLRPGGTLSIKCRMGNAWLDIPDIGSGS